jgi:hypothetical protein
VRARAWRGWPVDGLDLRDAASAHTVLGLEGPSLSVAEEGTILAHVPFDNVGGWLAVLVAVHTLSLMPKRC